MKKLVGLLIGCLLLTACASAQTLPSEGGQGGATPPKATSTDSFAADNARSAASQGGAPAADQPQQSTTDRMIVYNANISLGVESVSQAVASVRGLAEGVGGLVAGVSTGFQKDKETASVTIRVPASAYNQVMTDLRKLAVKVNSENGSARDVTEEYTDLDAQLRNLRATEAQLLELMKRAVTIDEILKVQTQLTQTRGQIERIQGRMNLLQRTSDMATIVVNIAPADTITPQSPWDPGRTFEEAWAQSLVVVRFVADLGIRAMVFALWLLPLALVALAIILIGKRFSKPAVATEQATSQ